LSNKVSELELVNMIEHFSGGTISHSIKTDRILTALQELREERGAKPLVSPAVAEALTLLEEGCGQLIERICTIRRTALHAPDARLVEGTNWLFLSESIGFVQAAMSVCESNHAAEPGVITRSRNVSLTTLQATLRHAKVG
jgi:hypothetical protein